MASTDALKALLAALEAEQKRRQAAQFGDRDPRTWLVDTLEQMARRMTATAHLGPPLDVSDLSLAERVSCCLLPEELRPEGLGTEDEIWAEFEAHVASMV
jgi:hypothetical protein